jgi:thiamine pyrophosphate-dependent acetolactate synthase large subunit-like protein
MTQPSALDLLRNSDAILCVGSELSETDFWSSDVILDKNLIRIDIDESVLARPHTADISIHAAAKVALAGLAALLPKTRPDRHADSASLVQRLREEDRRADNKLRQTLARVLAVIREALPPETVIASDMTQIAYAANEVFPLDNPRTWIHPVGFGTLGFALPAGIGAKFGKPDTPVAVMIGDYGIQYTINELGTAAEHKLPLVILMWNNDALGQIRDDMIWKGIQPNAVTLKNPDFQMLAKAYDCVAEKPASLAALSQAIKRALAADRPTLIEMTPRMVQ